MLVSNPVHSIGPEQSLLFKVIFECCILFWKCPMQSFAVCLTWPVTVLNCPSLYTVFPRVLIGREIAVSRDKISLCCSILSTLHLLLPSGDVKGLSFSNICVKITGFYAWQAWPFQILHGHHVSWISRNFSCSLPTVPFLLKQCEPVDIFRFPARNWAAPKREGESCL